MAGKALTQGLQEALDKVASISGDGATVRNDWATRWHVGITPNGLVKLRKQAKSAFTKGRRWEKEQQLSLGDEIPGAQMKEQLGYPGADLM